MKNSHNSSGSGRSVAASIANFTRTSADSHSRSIILLPGSTAEQPLPAIWRSLVFIATASRGQTSPGVTREPARLRRYSILDAISGGGIFGGAGPYLLVLPQPVAPPFWS